MADRLTDGTRSAGRWTRAHVHALAIDAGVSGRTFGVRAAASNALAALADGSTRADFIIGANGAAQTVNALFIVKALAVSETLLSTVRRLATTSNAAGVHN